MRRRILNYLNELPTDSSKLNSKANFDYDLSVNNQENNSFYNKTKIPDSLGKLDSVDCSKDSQTIAIIQIDLH